MASLEFQTTEVSREAETASCGYHSASLQTLATKNERAFDYLLREPRHARLLWRTLHIMTGIVALSAIAYVLYGCIQ